MKMKKIIFIILNTILWSEITSKSIAKDEEIEVKLQFLEYELEDFCILKNEAEWKFFNGSSPDLKKLLEVELKESEFYKNELTVLQKHMGKKFSKEKLQRLIEIFSHPGPPLLGNLEFKEYREYSTKLQELMGTVQISECDTKNNESDTTEKSNSNATKTEEKCGSINYNKMNKFLFEEKNEKKLKNTWINWFKEVEKKNKKTKYDFVQQLSILDLEAEQNGEEELTEYWLKQSDITLVNYDTVQTLWKEIQPLYEKLQLYMISLITQNYGENVFYEKDLIPVHLLGSLQSQDWVTAAEKLGAFENSDIYKSIKSSLKQKKIQDLYRIADNLTAELKLEYLPKNFYNISRFNQSGKQCQNKRMNYCERENAVRVMFCADENINLNHYFTVNEDTMKMKYLLLSGKEEEENGFLFRGGSRSSVLHEAMSGLSGLRAFSIENLQNQKLLTNQTRNKNEILSLIVTALHIIPPLPYYLSTDLWRINALQEMDAAVGENTADATTLPPDSSTSYNHERESRQAVNENNTSDDVNTNADNESTLEETQPNYNVSGEGTGSTKSYDTQNLTNDWWSYRKKLQGVGSPDGIPYEDYLQDMNVIWNKPYISKFLATILQFQIMEYIKNENSTIIFQTLMRKGMSKPWETSVAETFNITEISAKPLLKYFKPLEEFLDKGNKLKNSTRLFDFDDFKFISQGFSLNPVNNEEGEKPAEGSDALFFSLAVIAAVAVVAVIVTVGRRRYKKKQRIRERKRRLAEL